MNMSKQKIILFIIVIFIVGILLVCKNPFRPRESEEGFMNFPVIPVDWENPEKPMPSLVMDEKEVPKEAIKIGITAKGFSPSSFEVNKGEELVLSVTSQDEWVHVFAFEDESLAKIALGVRSGEWKAITFYAPSEPGEYEFYCDVPGHKRRGETGVMIVK